jgi:hypothetical protein
MMDEFEDFDFEDVDAGEGGAPGGDNRTFLIVAGVLGGILLLALIAIAAYAVVILPGQQAGQQEQAQSVNATNTAIALQSQQTAIAKQFTSTPPPSATPLPSDTPVVTATATSVLAPTSTNTPVVATQQATETPDPEELAATSTVAALLTQQAGDDGDQTATPVPTATALPDTGFADNIGPVELLAAAVILVMVIVISRRLRSSSA